MHTNWDPIGLVDEAEVLILTHRAQVFRNHLRQPDATRSVITWGAAGVLSDPSGQVREASSASHRPTASPARCSWSQARKTSLHRSPSPFGSRRNYARQRC
ncbi:MAG: hypothetical protein ACR2H5_26360 [Ktedonobacteraceae bacterium]